MKMSVYFGVWNSLETIGAGVVENGNICRGLLYTISQRTISKRINCSASQRIISLFRFNPGVFNNKPLLTKKHINIVSILSSTKNNMDL